MQLTTKQVYEHRDAEFQEACASLSLDACDAFGRIEGGSCSGCPAWESLRARVEARTTPDEPRALLVDGAGI